MILSLPRSIARAMTLLLLLGGALACDRAWAATEAGSIIRNRAEITWIDADTGETLRASSNTATVVVGVVRRFTLAGPPDRTSGAGASETLVFRLDNTGNIADRYRLSPVDLGDDAGELAGLAVHLDANGNGIVDADEPPLAQSPLLEPGASLALLVVARVPTAALAGERHALELHAENGDGAALAAPAAIDVLGGAVLTIERTLDIECATPIAAGGDVGQLLGVTNEGSAPPTARAHLIDGVARDGVLVVDPVPTGFRLPPDRSVEVAPASAIALVQQDGETGGWTRLARRDAGRPVRRLGLFVPAEALGAGERATLVSLLHAPETLAPGAAGRHVAGVDLDGDGRDEIVSAPVCTEPEATEPPRLPSGAVTLAFVAPAPDVRRSGALPAFAATDDFVATGSYALDGGRGGYEIARDGLYLELGVRDLPDGAVLGDTGAAGRSVVVTLESLGTADSLEVVLLETAPGSGVFRSVRPIAVGTARHGGGAYCPGGEARPADPVPDYAANAPACALASEPDDTLRVLFGDLSLGVELTATVVVGRTARVFDSRDLAPVPGATVTIRQGGGEGEEGTLVVDPATGETLARVSDERGVYDVPLLPPGTGYRVHVEPPPGHRFPSVVAPADLPDRDVRPSAYGAAGIDGASGVFDVAPGGIAPIADIPLDPIGEGTRLALVKRALAVETEPGGVVAYSLEVTNRSAVALTDVRVADRLPFGFKFVLRTTRVDGERVADPAGAPGTRLEFALGDLEPGEGRELEYVLEATAGALDGDGTNVARASASAPGGVRLRSAESRARVRVARAGVLSDRAALFGKVYVDADCNALQNDAEWPIGGVRLYLDDGTFAITDENGQYSLYGLAPGTRVLRVDPLTVPEGLDFKPLDNANAAAGDSRFVALAPGDFHRADFAVSCPNGDVERVFAELRERNLTLDGSWLLEEAERFDPSESAAIGGDRERAPDTSAIDIDGDLSNGILNGPDAGRARADRRADEDAEARPVVENGAGGGTVRDAVVARALDPEEAVSTITAEQAKTGTWLWPANDTSLDGRFVAVVRAGIEPTLYVEGRPVPATQIGERIENRRERAQIVAWYGVALEPGPNRVEVRGTDGFGNVRTLAEGEFKRPAVGTRMVLRARTDTLPADGGRSVLPIEIVVLDDNDYPAQGVHFVTLETSETGEGAWLEADLRPDEPGHQVRVEDGRATATLRSSDFTGALVVRARSDTMGANLRVVQVAALRPLFGVGLLEIGTVSGELMGNGFAPSAQADGLVDGTRTEGRLSMFLKGRVRGDAQLTLSYDSDKGSDTELLRDIDPGAHYPIHGDASVRGYEAQSRSPLYAKLEKGKSSVMWGDYVTDGDADVDDLARVQRVLTGFNARVDAGRTRFQLFAASSEEGRRVEEIPGNGTAMLFRLAGAPIVPNSEIVELIVRDRDNPGLVISTTRLSRFGDYAIDSIGGELSFGEPVPSVDESLNPVFVRVSYDQERGGESHAVAGVRGRVALTESLVAGASFTDDAAPNAGGTLAGAYLAWRPREGTAVTLGAARATHADGRAPGDARRLGVEHRWGADGARRTSLVAGRAEEGFDGTEAGIGAGRRELRLEHDERLSATLRAAIEATHSESLAFEELRRTYGATLAKSFERWSLRAGARRIRQRSADEDEAFTTAVGGVERRLEIGGRAASGTVEYEQDLARASRNRLALGATLAVHEHADLNARYERQSGIQALSSLGGTSTTETFALGVESDLFEDTRLYSEYRMRGGIDGRDLVTASGVRGSYELAPGLSLSPAIEVIDTIAGDDGGDGVAVSVGVNDTRNPNARASAQAEYRDGRSTDYIGLRGSYAARLDLDWTAIVREDFRRSAPDAGAIDLRHAFTLGLARRPRLDNRHHLLFQYQWKVERAEGEARDRDVHVLSTHQNLQLGPDLVLAGRLGGKRQTTFLANDDHDTAAWLADARAIWDLDRRWSVDLRAGVLATGRAGRSRRHAFGVGLSHVLERNLLLELGYNVAGFRDEDLDPEGYDAQGVRFGLRYKFDEKAFGWLDDRSDPA